MRQLLHGFEIAVGSHLKPFGISDILGVFVGSQVDFASNNIRVIESEVGSEVITLFQVAFGFFLKVLCSQTLISAVESSNV